MKAAVSRVFSPGTGATPPALTGREREQAVLTQCLADLLGGASPPHDVVMVGPRGNGKTVLLNWFERACRDHDPEVDVATLTPNDIPTRDELVELLSQPSPIAKLLPRKVGVAAVGSVEWAREAQGAGETGSLTSSRWLGATSSRVWRAPPGHSISTAAICSRPGPRPKWAIASFWPR